MRTEIFLENNRLDIIRDEQSLITFAIDDILDFGSRQTKFSKTIILPGTANNNKIFGHIFQVGNSNEYNPALPNFGYNFNASKSANVIIFQDNIQTFKGVLRLLQIDSVQGQIEYQASVFGELFSLNVALTGGLLSDLDFSDYNHTFSTANIIASWDNEPGSGYYYPLIDYGGYSENKKDWGLGTFRPALYVKEFIDKMFERAGFRYSSELFNTDRFKRLVVPNNQKFLFSKTADLLYANIPDPNTFTSPPGSAFTPLREQTDIFYFDTSTLGSSFTTVDNHSFTYVGVNTFTIDLNFSITGNYYGPYQYNLDIRKNGLVIHTETLPESTTPYTFTKTIAISITVAPGDIIATSGLGKYINILSYELNLTSMSLTIKASGSLLAPVSIGETVDINFNLPKNIRQVDFLLSIVQLFNLYVYEDKFDDKLIHITPYIDFYGTDTTRTTDWTYKLDRSKPISLKPMSELNSKIYNFNLKPDEDYYNDLYKKRYGQVYGSYIFDSEFEFTDAAKKIEIIFSPTPLVGYTGEEKVYPTIFKKSGDTEEPMDSNIRILQTKKVTGVASWAIKNGSTSLATTTTYGYAGHYDDPDAPSNDLNFGALKEVFFDLVSGDLSPTQFNVYWSSYMAEITDKDSKLLKGEFYLKPSDIFNLDFSKYITIDGVLFKLNKIEDYDMNKPANSKCALLKVNYTQY